MRQSLKFRSALAAMSAAILIAGAPAQSLPVAPAGRWAEPARELAPAQVRAGGRFSGGRGGAVVRGPRGGMAAVGGSRYRGGVYRGGRYYGGGATWVRPYRWAPGGAIAAGAALGFVTAATAAAWASAPTRPGLCWYYTDPSRRSGFWDNCP